MKNEIEVISHFANIVDYLYHKDLISKKDYEDYKYCKDKISYLINHICDLFLLALDNNVYNSIKKDFAYIYESIKNNEMNNSNQKTFLILGYLKYWQNESIVDGKFDPKISDKITSVSYKVIVSEEKKEKLLEELYCLGADIYDYGLPSNDMIKPESIAIFNEIAEVEVFTGYLDKDNNYHINAYLTENDSLKRKEIIIPSQIKHLCYKIIDKKIMIESLELLFLYNLLKGSLFSYLELFELVGQIDFNVFKTIKDKIIIRDFIVKENQNGLQKIS